MSDHQAAAAKSASRTETSGAGNPLTSHPIVSRSEWLEGRKAFLAKEKEFPKFPDQLNAEQRALPWVRIEKEYVFDGPSGKITLAQLFGGRSQLFIKHFMMGPGQTRQCVGCSFEVDHVQGLLPHFENHDLTYAAVARAPIDEIEALRKRMGWNFTWVSSYHSDFNYDFNVSFTPEQIAAGTAFYNFQQGNPGRRSLRRQRFPQRRFRPDLPHLFHIRPGRRAISRRLQLFRRNAERPQRKRPLSLAHRLGSPVEYVRQGRYG